MCVCVKKRSHDDKGFQRSGQVRQTLICRFFTQLWNVCQNLRRCERHTGSLSKCTKKVLVRKRRRAMRSPSRENAEMKLANNKTNGYTCLPCMPALPSGGELYFACRCGRTNLRIEHCTSDRFRQTPQCTYISITIWTTILSPYHNCIYTPPLYAVAIDCSTDLCDIVSDGMLENVRLFPQKTCAFVSFVRLEVTTKNYNLYKSFIALRWLNST